MMVWIFKPSQPQQSSESGTIGGSTHDLGEGQDEALLLGKTHQEGPFLFKKSPSVPGSELGNLSCNVSCPLL
jgi:hypothetical protein